MTGGVEGAERESEEREDRRLYSSQEKMCQSFWLGIFAHLCSQIHLVV